jgi:hypothetical protein
MTADKMQPNAKNKPEQAKPEQVGQQMPPNQASAAARPDQGAASGRRAILHLTEHAADVEPHRR